jgi:HEAT repeat protein
MRLAMRGVLFAVVSGLLGCATGPRAAVMSKVEQRDVRGALLAYERFRRDEEPDGELLANVASLILEKEALRPEPDRREAAIHQLDLAGTAGRDALHRLAEERSSPKTRARALESLARRRVDSARDELRTYLDHEDPEVQACAVYALDAESEMDQLIARLSHGSGTVRLAAARALARSAPNTQARLALAETARVDPLAAVRGAAVLSLSAYGPDAVETLRERLSDPDDGVRMSAIGALGRTDREQARLALGPLLEMQPTPAGIEAARVLANAAEDDEGAAGMTDARAYLRRALALPEPRMRSQAATALASLRRDPSLDAALLEALRAEQDDTVKLALAGALRHRDELAEPAQQALRALLERPGLVRVQAAALLAPDGDVAALRVLSRALRDEDRHARRTAARALARDALQPDAARRALRDRDPMVRIYAAGGILAAAAYG